MHQNDSRPGKPGKPAEPGKPRQTLRAFGHRASMASIDGAGHGVDFSDPRVTAPLTAFLRVPNHVSNQAPNQAPSGGTDPAKR